MCVCFVSWRWKKIIFCFVFSFFTKMCLKFPSPPPLFVFGCSESQLFSLCLSNPTTHPESSTTTRKKKKKNPRSKCSKHFSGLYYSTILFVFSPLTVYILIYNLLQCKYDFWIHHHHSSKKTKTSPLRRNNPIFFLITQKRIQFNWIL